MMNSVYRVGTDHATYLVLAPSEALALQHLSETGGTSEDDRIVIGVVHPDRWGTICMHEDGGSLKAISALVAETKLAPGEAEVLCYSK